MRRIILSSLVVLCGSPLSAAETSLAEALKEMEIRDVLLEELDECLRVMSTSACVKTYQEQCADVFTPAEENIAAAMALEEADATSPLGGSSIWRVVDYATLSYTREEFPATVPAGADFTTGE